MENSRNVTVTLGELICAISEAAEEAHIHESDVAMVTQMILHDVLDEVRH